jgi:hypothetical protein
VAKVAKAAGIQRESLYRAPLGARQPAVVDPLSSPQGGRTETYRRSGTATPLAQVPQLST